jgi:hypothetical protein
MHTLTQIAIACFNDEATLVTLDAEAIQRGVQNRLALLCGQFKAARLEITENVAVVTEDDLIATPLRVNLQVVVVSV